jgi:GT2 family glycosyltransferase
VKLSVIIVNYNVKYFLEQCLKAVQKAMHGIDGEVWVVDNNSVDGSVAMLRQKFTWVNLIANTENTGFSKANNQAIKASHGEYVLLLNPDTVVEEDCFTKCLTFMDTHPKAGALGVRMVDGSGIFLPESKRGLPTPEVALYKMFGLNKLFPKSKKFGRYHLGFLPEHEINEVEVLAGAFMFMKREALEKVGLLDEAFFMYGEDIDLSYRIIKGGYKNYYFPETSIIHYKGESTKKGSANYVKIFYQAMVIFARKHYSGNKSRLLILLINTFIYLRAFTALVYRFISNWWLVMLDIILLFIGMFFLKSYWEEHIKFIKSYPKELMTIHVPYYIALWVGITYFGKGYAKPYSLKNIVRGVILATIAILAIYGLFPENLRFSRGLIILGSVGAVIEMTITRLIANYFGHGKFSLTNKSSHKLLIVGHHEEASRVFEMLKKSGQDINLLGFVSPLKNDTKGQYLGQIDNLPEIASVFKAEEIVFCSKDISAKAILEWMVKLGSKKIHYKIAPEASSFIIGSHSKNSNGQFFTEEITLRLANRDVRKQKRWFDMVSSLMLILTSVFWILFVKNRKSKWDHCIEVLNGKKTWVSYEMSSEIGVLPEINKGVFTTTQIGNAAILDKEIIDNLNYRYARYYSIGTDLEIIWNNFFNR